MKVAEGKLVVAVHGPTLPFELIGAKLTAAVDPLAVLPPISYIYPLSTTVFAKSVATSRLVEVVLLEHQVELYRVQPDGQLAIVLFRAPLDPIWA